MDRASITTRKNVYHIPIYLTEMLAINVLNKLFLNARHHVTNCTDLLASNCRPRYLRVAILAHILLWNTFIYKKTHYLWMICFC